ncbi:MAG: hypothetical protein WC852_05645 [Candidatus Nanoarchaeia archaeon]|jgi:hypothetical protein
MEKEGLLIRRCPKCGLEAKNNDTYCINCGVKLPAFCSVEEEKEEITPKRAGKLTKYMFYLGTALFAISLILFSIFVIIDKTNSDSLSEVTQNMPLISEQEWLNMKEQIEADTTGYYTFIGDKTLDVAFEEPLKNESNPYSINDPIPISVKITNKLQEDIPSGNFKVKLTGDATMPSFFSGANEPYISTLRGIDTLTGNENPESITIGPLQYVGDIVESAKIQKFIAGQYCYQNPLKVKAKLFYTPKSAYIGSNLNSGSNPPSPIQVTNIKQEPIVLNLQGIGELKFTTTVTHLKPRTDMFIEKGRISMKGGNVISSMTECFKFRDRLSKQILTLSADGAYPIECENQGKVQLSLDTHEGTISCVVKNINYTNPSKISSDITLTLDGFAYEGDIEPISIWIDNKPKVDISKCETACSCSAGHCECRPECNIVDGGTTSL